MRLFVTPCQERWKMIEQVQLLYIRKGLLRHLWRKDKLASELLTKKKKKEKKGKKGGGKAET